MLKSFVGGHSALGVNSKAAFDELASSIRYVAPVFKGSEGVICNENGLHFLKVGVPVEGGIAAEKEVGYDTDGPDITTTQRR